ncbi:MAG: right-handed parallel beta-helix repeat-containing protein [Planctomycetes bacterium]|nr:right-handed parallel beta-helix repeat-containing protein [Planctomycetota bacterium]
MIIPAALRFTLLLTMAFSYCSWSHAIEIRVPQDVAGIQKAIAIANDGDEIIVAAGIWNESIDFSGKNIVIRSEQGPENTLIEGTLGASVVVFQSGETSLAMLEGFKISGGGGTASSGPQLGGGLYISGSSPCIRDCIIEGNQASVGGGVFIDAGPSQQIVFEQVQILSNLALDSGGALAIIGVDSGVSLVNCVLQGNQSDTVAGAIYCEASSVQMQSCQITENSAEMLVGGVWLYLDSEGDFFDCEFSSNSSLIVGGAVVVSDFSQLTMERCSLFDNSGGASGGGLLFDVADDQLLQEVRHCVFHGNLASGSGADVVISFNPVNVTMQRCTFGPPAFGSASSIRVNNDYPGVLLLDSCIVIGGGIPSIDAQPGSTIAYYSCIEGLASSGIEAIDCIDEDPLFVDPAAGILTLQVGSPCIDSGNPALPLDPDGSAPDMGALGVGLMDVFRRGDVDGSSSTNLGDAIQILGMLFVAGSATIGCLDAGDCNDDGVLNISDPVTLLDHLFVSGKPLPQPFEECGPDPTADALECSISCP